MNVKIILQYDGSRFDGWQKQGNTENTIQGRLEAVLEKMCGYPVEVHGSGRTDRGVHALGQTANFHLPDGENWKVEQVRSYLNRYLPDDIRVLEAEQAPERFHSRLNAKSKTYRYLLETGEKRDVFSRRYVCALGKCFSPAPGQRPDLARMREAAGFLEGTHDFKGFSSLKKFKKSTVRTIESITFEENGTVLAIEYTGDGFLYNMIRILTGTLLEVGLGLRTPESVREILETGNREKAGKTMPPEGLALVRVRYF